MAQDDRRGDDEDSQFGDFIEDGNAVLPLGSAIQENLKETATRASSSLTPREERVLRMRFGVGMSADATREEVGRLSSITQERIRWIEARALERPKDPAWWRNLRRRRGGLDGDGPEPAPALPSGPGPLGSGGAAVRPNSTGAASTA